MTKLTKEDERMLEQYSKSVHTNSNHIIYGNAILVSLVPIWYFWRIQEMDLISNGALYVIIAICTAFIISHAYKSSKASLVDKIALKRTPAITKQIKENKRLNKKEQEDFIRQTTKEVAEYESTTFTIFYINALFIMFLIVLTSFFHQLSPQFNYIFTMLTSSGITVLLTQSSEKPKKY